jgi:CBS domain-containing protein
MPGTARDVLAMKNSAVVFTCPPEISVREACRMMRDRRVGSLVVVRDDEVQGLLSERDVVERVVAEGLDGAVTAVGDVMEREVAAVPLEADCAEIEAALRRRRAHYLTVVGSRGLLGVVSLGDLARFQALRRDGDAWPAGAP